MALLTNVIPIILGFIAKLIAIKSQQNHEAFKLAIQGNQVNNEALEKARAQANKESPMAALNRRVLVFSILGLVALYPLAGLFGIEVAIPVVEKGTSWLYGMIEEPETTTYITVEAMVKYEEIFKWATMIVEFYFGAQLAKGK